MSWDAGYTMDEMDVMDRMDTMDEIDAMDQMVITDRMDFCRSEKYAQSTVSID